MIGMLEPVSQVETGIPADIVERRRIIYFTHLVLLVATAVGGIVEIAGTIGPFSLRGLTILVGAGFTFYQPAH